MRQNLSREVWRGARTNPAGLASGVKFLGQEEPNEAVTHTAKAAEPRKECTFSIMQEEESHGFMTSPLKGVSLKSSEACDPGMPPSSRFS